MVVFAISTAFFAALAVTLISICPESCRVWYNSLGLLVLRECRIHGFLYQIQKSALSFGSPFILSSICHFYFQYLSLMVVTPHSKTLICSSTKLGVGPNGSLLVLSASPCISTLIFSDQHQIVFNVNF